MMTKFNYGDGVITLPAKVLDSLSNADENACRVLIALAGGCSADDTAALAALVGSDERSVKRAVDFWRVSGVISTERGPSAVAIAEHNIGGKKVSVIKSGEMPSYTGKEIEALFSDRQELGAFVDECQRILGKLLSVTEINKLIGLVDYYRFSGDFVLLLVKRSVEIQKGSVPYIVRTAVSMYNSGIVTIEALEEKIRDEDDFSAMEMSVRELFGIGKRALTEKEKKFIKNWTDWQIPDDMLELVYQITVDNTKGPSMPYMNKILTSWREAGYKTAADARAATELYRQKKASASGSSFDRDEFFEAAIRHSLEIHGKA